MIGELDKVINDSITDLYVHTFEVEDVRDLLQEECAELIQAISKVRRFPKDIARKDNLNEEVADVLILINDLIAYDYLSVELIEKYIVKKQERQYKICKDIEREVEEWDM